MVANIRCSDCGDDFAGVDEFEDHDCDEQDDDPDGGGAKALIADGGNYSRSEEEVALTVWQSTHQNGDETYVYVLQPGDTFYAFAADLDEDGILIEHEEIACPLTYREAVTAAERWMEENPKGVADNEGLLAGLLGGDG